MADQEINLKIPSDKVAIALEGFLKIYPNNEMTNDEPPTPKYTNAQWVREKIRRNIVRDIKRGLQMKANQEAQITEDNGIVE